jgi:hypothetical protein
MVTCAMNEFRIDPLDQIEAVDDRIAEILRKKTPEERLRIGFEIWISARRMLFNHIRHIHPEWASLEIDKEVARRFLHGTV